MKLSELANISKKQSNCLDADYFHFKRMIDQEGNKLINLALVKYEHILKGSKLKIKYKYHMFDEYPYTFDASKVYLKWSPSYWIFHVPIYIKLIHDDLYFKANNKELFFKYNNWSEDLEEVILESETLLFSCIKFLFKERK